MVDVRVIAIIFQSAVASAEGTTPTPDELTGALSRPRLEWCDEIMCTHRLGRQYLAREVKCDLLPLVEEVLCAYERTPFDFASVRPLRKGEANPPDTRRWEAAKTQLKRFAGQWIIISDSAD
jgi:hypothetical protein